MANTVITKDGADFVTLAGDDGLRVAIKYFLPIYDYRLDTNIHTAQSYSTSAIPYTDTIAVTSAQSVPTGEKIWNDTSYNLSTNFIVSGIGDISASIGGGAGTVSAYKQSSMGIGMNTLNGVPLQSSYYGTTFDPPSLSNNVWTIGSISGNAGVNVQTTGDRSKYWKVTDYYPVTDSLGNIRGAYKCHMDLPVGRFKFNKVAMYVVKMNPYPNADTEDLSVDPVFFAEAFVKETCVKSNVLQEGFDDYVIDVQLDVSPLNTYFTSAFYSTSGDYWSRTVGGLYYSDCVGIGSFSGSTDSPQATIHVRPVSNKLDKHLVRMDARGSIGTSAYQVMDVDNRGDLTLSGVSGTNNSIFRNYNVTSACDTLPIADNTYDLGTPSRRWRNVKAVTVSATDINGGTLTGTNISANYIKVQTISGTTATFTNMNLPALGDIVCNSVLATSNVSANNLVYNNMILPGLQSGGHYALEMTPPSNSYHYFSLSGDSSIYYITDPGTAIEFKGIAKNSNFRAGTIITFISLVNSTNVNIRCSSNVDDPLYWKFDSICQQKNLSTFKILRN